MIDAKESPLVLGAMMFGTRIDEPTSFAVLDRFVERGGVWIDTADCYAFWASESGRGGDGERLLGRWLAARPGVRDRVRIATKLGAEPLEPGSWPARREGLSAGAVRTAFAGSLERLGLDRVDLLWVHQEDRSVPIEETVDALGELVSAGSVDRVGASNHPAWRVERARAHALSTGSRAVRRAPAQQHLPPPAPRHAAARRRAPVRRPRRRAAGLRGGARPGDLGLHAAAVRRVRQPRQGDPRGLRPPGQHRAAGGAGRRRGGDRRGRAARSCWPG